MRKFIVLLFIVSTNVYAAGETCEGGSDQTTSWLGYFSPHRQLQNLYHYSNSVYSYFYPLTESAPVAQTEEKKEEKKESGPDPTWEAKRADLAKKILQANQDLEVHEKTLRALKEESTQNQTDLDTLKEYQKGSGVRFQRSVQADYHQKQTAKMKAAIAKLDNSQLRVAEVESMLPDLRKRLGDLRRDMAEVDPFSVAQMSMFAKTANTLSGGYSVVPPHLQSSTYKGQVEDKHFVFSLQDVPGDGDCAFYAVRKPGEENKINRSDFVSKVLTSIDSRVRKAISQEIDFPREALWTQRKYVNYMEKLNSKAHWLEYVGNDGGSFAAMARVYRLNVRIWTRIAPHEIMPIAEFMYGDPKDPIREIYHHAPGTGGAHFQKLIPM